MDSHTLKKEISSDTADEFTKDAKWKMDRDKNPHLSNIDKHQTISGVSYRYKDKNQPVPNYVKLRIPEVIYYNNKVSGEIEPMDIDAMFELIIE